MSWIAALCSGGTSSVSDSSASFVFSHFWGHRLPHSLLFGNCLTTKCYPGLIRSPSITSCRDLGYFATSNFSRVSFTYMITFLHHCITGPSLFSFVDLVVYLFPMTAPVLLGIYLTGSWMYSPSLHKGFGSCWKMLRLSFWVKLTARLWEVLVRHQQMSCWFQKSVLQKHTCTQRVIRNTDVNASIIWMDILCILLWPLDASCTAILDIHPCFQAARRFRAWNGLKADTITASSKNWNSYIYHHIICLHPEGL